MAGFCQDHGDQAGDQIRGCLGINHSVIAEEGGQKDQHEQKNKSLTAEGQDKGGKGFAGRLEEGSQHQDHTHQRH